MIVHDNVKKILTARVYDVAIESPLDPMPRLSRRIGGPVYLKRGDLQPVFSFKLRGAYNKMNRLDRGEHFARAPPDHLRAARGRAAEPDLRRLIQPKVGISLLLAPLAPSVLLDCQGGTMPKKLWLVRAPRASLRAPCYPR